MLTSTRGLLRISVLAAMSLAIAGAVSQALAHHSGAMFDRDKPMTITGTVTKFEWTNPHTYIELDVPESGGAVKHYTIEGSSPNVLKRVGWKFNELKPGDKVTLVINPMRTGEPSGMLERAILADGRTMVAGGIIPAGGKK